MGRWTVLDKKKESYLGWCGLRLLEESGNVDLGFRFLKKHWNQGIATEAAKAALKVGFDLLNLESVIGRAIPENKGSIRVLEKVGLSYWKDGHDHGSPIVIYKIDKADFLKNGL
jgi:RimJ/RimL family protein N-acetyltransferase